MTDLSDARALTAPDNAAAAGTVGSLTSLAALRALNHDCFCFSLDEASLASALDDALGQAGLSAAVRERCPHLFSAQPVFIGAQHLQRIADVIEAVEAVVALPAFRAEVLAAAPASARACADAHDAVGGPRGVFFGYDFHLDGGRLGLIEVNTNAGGAMLNAVLAQAQRACCPPLAQWLPTAASVQAFEQAMVDMFQAEWRLSGQTRPLRSIAIVDQAPATQYLYSEFQLFQHLFQRHGLQAVIADPTELTWRDGQLWHGALAIDLVYNRLTDFYLEQPDSQALRQAWQTHAVVLTPNPQTHALYADKRHLALFSDAARLEALGVPTSTCQVLMAHVPKTEVVRPGQADRLWAERRHLFFKPTSGFGSRAAYRGDKLTQRVWQDILAGDYVAQALLPPGERTIPTEAGETDCTQTGATTDLKFDLRVYAYDGVIQWVAARLYQGQTTNFRTPGGGFAPVYCLPENPSLCSAAPDDSTADLASSSCRC